MFSLASRDLPAWFPGLPCMALVVVASATSATKPSSTSAAPESPTCPDGRITFAVEPFEDPAKLLPAVQVLGGAPHHHRERRDEDECQVAERDDAEAVPTHARAS